MNLKFSVTLFLILLSIKSYSQQNKPQIPFIVSEEVINKGTNYHDEEKYTYAIEEYEKVPLNDTNYGWAMYEKGLSYAADSQWTEAEKALRECLKMKFYDKQNVYSLLGSTLDDEGKMDEAIEIFQEGLKEFPNYYLLHYNYGITLNKKKDIAGAIREFQTAIYLNPFHPGSHFQLGLLCYKYNQPVPCLFSFTMYLLLKPNSPLAVSIMLYMQDFAQLKDPQVKPDSGLEHFSLWQKGENDFNKYNFLLHNGQAKSKSFKGQTKLTFDLAKQLDQIFQSLSYNPNDAGFWNKVYVPVYEKIQKSGGFASMIYMCLSNLDQPDIQKYVKKHSKDFDNFGPQARQFIIDNSNQFPVNVNGTDVIMNRSYGQKNFINVLTEKINYEKNIGYGKCYSFYSNSKIKAIGQFNSSGDKDGTWKYFDEFGVPSSEETLVNGKLNGPYIVYFSNGVMSDRYTMKDGKFNDTAYTYNVSGNIYGKIAYSNGVKNGAIISYYDNGAVDFIGNYLNDKADGTLKRYYLNGKLKAEENYKDDKLQGAYSSYFENGKVKSKGNYDKGKRTGKWEYFYENGKPSSVENYNQDGESDGTETAWYENGVTEYIEEYKNGNEAHYTRFDEDGKKYYEMTFEDEGKLSSWNFYSKNGELLKENKINSSGQSTVSGFYPTGEKWFTGFTLRNKRDGEWNYFYLNGLPDYTTNYVDGYQVGAFKSWDKTGWLNSTYSLKDNNIDGYYRSYYSNGNIYREGWYKDGNMEGVWHSYFPDGGLASDEYYIKDEKHGIFTYYDHFGHILDKEYIELNVFVKHEVYDTLGNILQTSVMPAGNGHIRDVYINGKTSGEGEMQGGKPLDGYKFFNPDGTELSAGHYLNGERTGEWKSFFPNGNLYSIQNYKDGEQEGYYADYNEDGLLSREGYIKDGNDDSTCIYYYEGSKAKDYVTQYKYGEEDGYAYKYYNDGQVACRFNYKNGIIISYSYNAPDGSWVPEIKLNTVDSIVTKYKNGNTAMIIHITNGFYEGKFLWYHPNGKLKQDRIYHYDALEGPALYYNDKGVLIRQCFFKRNNYYGTCTRYYDDGKLKREENWFDDKREGAWKYYDKTGKLTKTEHYWHDDLMSVN